MRALWSLAPLPLYTGKPAPVIFTPRSKSMMSYFFASSQCGRAFSGRFGSGPPIFTTRLSSAPFPSGTRSQGRLGRRTMASSSSFWFSAARARSSPERALSDATSAFAASASALRPCFRRAPIFSAAFFCWPSRLSDSCWQALRLSSSAITFSTSARASKFFLASFRTTSSGSSRSCLSVSILSYLMSKEDVRSAGKHRSSLKRICEILLPSFRGEVRKRRIYPHAYG